MSPLMHFSSAKLTVIIMESSNYTSADFKSGYLQIKLPFGSVPCFFYITDFIGVQGFNYRRN